MFRDTSGQKVTLLAFNTSTGAPVAGDAANLTAYVSKDDGTVTALADTSATELDATNAKGSYAFDVAQAESNADKLVFTGKSVTANIAIPPLTIYTRPPLVGGRIDASVGAMAANVMTAAAAASDLTTELQSGLATQASVDDLPTNAELVTALGTADDATLAAIAALNNLSQANIRTAVGLASANLDTQLDALPTNAELATALGTADDATLAAIAALNNLSQANIRTAVGLASANLDTQLDALPTNAELDTALAAADDATLAAIAALNNLSVASIRTAVGLATANLDTQLAAISAKTGNLPADPADASDIAASFSSIVSTLATMAAYVDTEVAAIKAKTDKLTFDADNTLDVNLQKINDVALLGDGASVPWGPQ